MTHNIVLVGMPASGKTTIGTLLAEKLNGYSLYDTDSIIEKTQGMTINENRIISIGGGSFENPDNRATLLKFGKVFYLKSDLDILYYRISQDSTRPLLQRENPRQVLENMLKKREENYKRAHFTVDTSSLSEDEIVRFIINETNSAS